MATQVSLNSGAVASAGALAIQTNGTTQAVSISTGQVATLAQNPILTSGTANGVAYLNGSKVLTTGSALTFNGSALAVTGTLSASGQTSITGGALRVFGALDAGQISAAVMDWQSVTNNARFLSYGPSGTSGGFSWTTVIGGGAGTQAMTLDASGNLGIGTTSPGSKLTVSNGTVTAGINPYTPDGVCYFGTTTNHGLAFLTNGAERARIDSSGNLLVGTTSKFAGGIDGLDLNTAGETGITFGKSGVVKNYFYLITNESAFQWQTVSGVAVNIISSTNGVTLANGGTSWGSLSDERKKDIIEPITDATTKVSGLRAVIGKYKTEEDGIRRAMLIAQDVQAVLPEAVTENADGDLILQYTDTIPLLVAAIKEQTALITQLQARITALEGA